MLKQIYRFFFGTGYRPSKQDRQNEAKLRDLYEKIIKAKNPEVKRRLWSKYTKLHNARSPELVTHLEKQRGLYRE